ncbi:VWA domain-containing protein (plasmid) [Deinococcus taeanensis]|uniref:VWA domain-containing protein n=1 Tax=Deinococcus taeanensis TaxID=2737050 RepID=UPI001CDD7C4F|nr:VWA domain-containing protein [Deinococcus taeanensis]UBV44622.1 VWA domain-containing protein [Deinococcus taeanensis]
MQTFQTGQKSPLSSLTDQSTLVLTVRVRGPAPEYDLILFGLDEAGTLSDDRYMVFFNQPASPEGALRLQAGAHTEVTFQIDLGRLPSTVRRLSLAATVDGGTFGQIDHAAVTLSDGCGPCLTYQVTGRDFQQQKAVMLLDLYVKDVWRVAAVGQGFDGGLAALVRHFGGEVADDPPAAPVNLKKERQRVLLEKAQQQAPELVSLIKAAQVSLEKRGLDDARYRVKLVLDISGSMHDEYRTGAVQELANRALALAVRLDDDGEVDVYLFGIKPHRKGKLSLDNARSFVQGMRVKLEGGTHYGPVMAFVREDVSREGRDLPTLVLFITDGGTSNPAGVIQQMRDAAREPIFWKFMGIEQGHVNFDFLEKLDDLTGRVVDNADFFKVPSPVRLPDAQLFDALVNELDVWQRDARRAGILQ